MEVCLQGSIGWRGGSSDSRLGKREGTQSLGRALPEDAGFTWTVCGGQMSAGRVGGFMGLP